MSEETTNFYEGEYADDFKNGYGEYHWENGLAHYKGNYKDDFKEGYGEMKWSDGSLHKGHWKSGI